MCLTKYETACEKETIAVAVHFASSLHRGDVVLLHGDLGMGKSVFARAVIRALSGDDVLAVPSPTFTLIQNYDTEHGVIWHFDLYRVHEPEEVYEIGWEDALAEGIVLVEWPERLGFLKPEKTIDITLSASHDGHYRRIEIKK